MKTDQDCLVPGCADRKRRADYRGHGTLTHGMCSMHYQREHYGYRTLDRTDCTRCGWRKTYKEDGFCHNCRQHPPAPAPVCPSCGTTFERKGGTDKFCGPSCNPNPSGGHGTPAYRKAKREGDRIVPLAVFTACKWRCHLCGEKVDRDLTWPDPASASLDHVRPISKGGTHTYFNVRLAHLMCNQRKGNRR